MIDRHRIKISELNESFIQELKASQKSDDTVVYLQVLPNESGEVLTDDQFWEIISRLDWSKEKEGDAEVVKPVVEYLSSLPVSLIYQFENKLAEKLYALDTKAHASHIGEDAWKNDDEYFSVDIFLYARACVIANGRKLYEQVLSDPEKMPKDLTFESLLYVAHDAYQKKTGKPFDFLSSWNYETFGNKEGWK